MKVLAEDLYFSFFSYCWTGQIINKLLTTDWKTMLFSEKAVFLKKGTNVRYHIIFCVYSPPDNHNIFKNYILKRLKPFVNKHKNHIQCK